MADFFQTASHFLLARLHSRPHISYTQLFFLSTFSRKQGAHRTLWASADSPGNHLIMSLVKLLVEVFSLHVLFKKINITMQKNHYIPIEMAKIKINDNQMLVRILLLGTCPWEVKTMSIMDQGPAASYTQMPILWHPLLRQEKAFICKSTGKETRGRAQICLPSPGFKAELRGFQHRIFLDNGLFASERVLGLRFQSCLGPMVLLGAIVRGSQVLLINSGSRLC